MDVNRWLEILLGLWVKVNVMKMNIIPHLIYVPRAISILTLNKHWVNKLFRIFISENGSLKFSLAKLKLLFKEDVFSLSDLYTYP